MRKFLQTLIVAVLLASLTGVVFALVFDHLQGRNAGPETNQNLEVARGEEEEKQVEPEAQTVKVELKEGSIVSVVSEVKNSVVSVLRYKDFLGAEPQVSGSGSGVFYKEDQDNYYLITNAHVVKEADQLQIQLADESKVKAELAGSDADTDLAVLKIKKSEVENKKQIKLAEIGDSDKLVMGESVFAVGNALGLGQSVTKGIVSAVGREIGNESHKSYKLIQTDAAINPGNSGGALFNIEGKLIGINSQKIAGTRIEGVGFAIPINAAYEISTVLLEKGSLPMPYIGVVLEDMNLDALDYYNIPRGVFVNQVVDGSPAQKAGLQAKDLILKINGEETLRSQTLRSILRTYEPGQTVKLTIFRTDHIEEIDVVLAEKPAQNEQKAPASQFPEEEEPEAGENE